MRLLLIAGHHSAGIYSYPHLRDPGAIPPYKNSTFNPPIYNEAHECQKLVSQTSIALNKEGFQTKVCPFTYNLPGKIKWANKNGSYKDILFEIHLNSSSVLATGTEIFYYDPKGNTAHLKKTADNLANLVYKIMMLKNRGSKQDTQSNVRSLGILRLTEPLAYLFELGFINNVHDMIAMRKTGVQAIIECAKYFLK